MESDADLILFIDISYLTSDEMKMGKEDLA